MTFEEWFQLRWNEANHNGGKAIRFFEEPSEAQINGWSINLHEVWDRRRAQGFIVHPPIYCTLHPSDDPTSDDFKVVYDPI